MHAVSLMIQLYTTNPCTNIDNLTKTGPLRRPKDALQRVVFKDIFIVQCSMSNKHTFIDVSAYSNMPITRDPEENLNESVLIPHNALYNKDPSKNFDAEWHHAGANAVRF